MNRGITPAYLAGVVDSDGSLSIAMRHMNRPNPTYQAVFQLTWTKSFKTTGVFTQLISEYGGSFFEEKLRKSSYKNSKTTIKYMLTGEKLKKFLKDIQPYSLLKYEQINNLLELIDNTHSGMFGFGRPKPEELKQLQHKLYLDNKKLNTKNSGNRSSFDRVR